MSDLNDYGSDELTADEYLHKLRNMVRKNELECGGCGEDALVLGEDNLAFCQLCGYETDLEEDARRHFSFKNKKATTKTIIKIANIINHLEKNSNTLPEASALNQIFEEIANKYDKNR